jgi:hypothetical protein
VLERFLEKKNSYYFFSRNARWPVQSVGGGQCAGMAGGHLLHDPQQLITRIKKLYPIKIFIYICLSQFS